MYNVLFLCTGNSARSVMGEVLLNHWGRGRFQGFSAGSQPKGAVHPITLDVLYRSHLPTEGLRSKSWDEFSGPGAPQMDFVFTVCDNAANEPCPFWPGQPMTAHWGVADPAEAKGTDEEIQRAFVIALRELEARIKLFVSLPIETVDKLTLQRTLAGMGRGSDPGPDEGARPGGLTL